MTTSTRPRSAREVQPPAPRIERADLISVVFLVVIPLLIFAVPAMLGHNVVPGDDYTQNFPLRAFVGSQARHGHLPLYNPYIWSGAPLLGGWNAGAAYPLTLLFVVMPATGAWALNLVATWWVAGIGSFAFLRASRLSALPCFLGAFTFSFSGAMAAQVVHFGLVAGVSWVPLTLLALLELSTRASPEGGATQRLRLPSRLRWCVVLAVSFAMTILAGEPRAVTTSAVIVVVYVLWRTLRLGRDAGGFVLFALVGLLLGVGLGAVQLLPGLSAVNSSQRAASNAYLFTSGSLPNRWLLLMVVPDLLGGSGSFGQPAFLAPYNLTEVAGYVGIMPLAASFALLGQLRRRRPLPEWIVWEIVAIVGIVLTLGDGTPLWHLIIHIPFFGSQRLQSRNILIADMGFAFLLAYWADSWFGSARAPSVSWLLHRRNQTLSNILGAVPGLLAVGTVIVGIAWGAGLLDWLGTTLRAASLDGSLRMWFLPFAVLGIGSTLLLLLGSRLERVRRMQVLTTFVVVDVIVYALLSVVAADPALGSAAPSSASSTTSATTTPGTATSAPAQSASLTTHIPASHFTEGGRFAIYDPDLIDENGLDVIGAPDLNVIDAIPSVQGYSSIVDGSYASATGAHQSTGLGQNILDPKALANGALDQLAMTVLFAPRDYFLVAAPHDAASPVPSAGERHLRKRGTGTWNFGADEEVRSFSVPDPRAASDLAKGLRFGLVTLDGRFMTAPVTVASTGRAVESVLRSPQEAVALVADAGNGESDLGSPSITSSAGVTYVADGQLQAQVVPPHWSLRSIDGSFAVFHDNRAEPMLSLRPLPDSDHSIAGASVRAIGNSTFSPSSALVSSPHGVEVVRAVSAIPGWRASWTPRGGTTRSLKVTKTGLVQAVQVPPGSGILAWSYDPPGWTAGWLTTMLSLLAVCLMLLWAWRIRARRRDEPGGTLLRDTSVSDGTQAAASL